MNRNMSNVARNSNNAFARNWDWVRETFSVVGIFVAVLIGLFVFLYIFFLARGVYRAHNRPEYYANPSYQDNAMCFLSYIKDKVDRGPPPRPEIYCPITSDGFTETGRLRGYDPMFFDPGRVNYQGREDLEEDEQLGRRRWKPWVPNIFAAEWQGR